VARDLFCSALWPPHPLGRPVIGREEVIADIKREQILAYRQKYYQNSQIIISVSGNIEHQRVQELVEKTFVAKAEPAPARNYPPVNSTPQIICRSKDIEQIHLCLGTQGVDLKRGEKKLHAVQLLNTILGGGVSSRLFQEVREQKGLVYSIYSFHQAGHDTGMFCIYLALSPTNLPEALQITLNNLAKIRHQGVTKAELQRAKEQTKGSLFLSLESVNARMSRTAKQEIYLGKQISVEESVAQIEKITLDEIAEAAWDLFDHQQFTAATVGKWDNPELLTQLIRS
ncbi:MAG: insulinase family protein, partial [Clostridia bacterium]|nr:insulinase family protein [Clostridia bacterium]